MKNSYQQVRDVDAIDLLEILKSNRVKLLGDFINENPTVYSNMFKYENDDYMMNLSRENYFLGFINRHVMKYDENAIKHGYDEKVKKAFAAIMYGLIESSVNYHKQPSDLYTELLARKIKAVRGIMEIGDNSNQRYQELLYSYEKDNALFARLINKEQRNGN